MNRARACTMGNWGGGACGGHFGEEASSCVRA
jgi:hypothetical protein